MKKLKELQYAYGVLHKEVVALVEGGDMGDDYETKNAELATMDKQIAALKALADAAPADTRIGLPLGDDTPPGSAPTAEELKALTRKSINVIRFSNNIDDHQEHVLREVYGANWRQLFAEQDEGFKSFLRVGGEYVNMERELYKRGERRHWDPADVIDMLKDGMNVAEIKATMVTGSSTLGGYAVPPQRARQILSEAMGMTVVRQAGAWVVRTNSTSVDWLKITGATKGSYPSGLRGEWVGETASPNSKNFEYGTETITTSLYSYKIALSQTLLETAQNVVRIVQEKISETIAIDEDFAFLYGDGVAKPRGIMPGGTPDTGINEVQSTHGTATFNVEDVKGLRREIATAYRMTGRAVYAMNGATAKFIEAMQDSEGRFYHDTIGAGQKLYGFNTWESEALDDIASDAYPLLFGDMRGYVIVEAGPGLEIFRFRDSNTGPNVVEFHIRRRLGGRVVEPYRFAALQCST